MGSSALRTSGPEAVSAVQAFFRVVSLVQPLCQLPRAQSRVMNVFS
jgi:hypothetical protein